ENGSEANNTRAQAGTLAISARPRPDLQVSDITIPTHAPAGGTLTAEFTVTNQGPVATDVPAWTDRVYLSLDPVISPDDVLMGELPNQAALTHGGSYRSGTSAVTIPKRFRGDFYVLVTTDFGNRVEEWPNENNNLTYKAIHIDPLPLPDLVAEAVV